MSRIPYNLFHIFLVAPLFAYIGYNKQSTPQTVFTMLTFIGAFIILYHAYRYYYTSWSINLMHVVIIGPLLLYFGLKGSSLPDPAFNVFYVASAIILIWHSYLLYTRLSPPTV